MRNARKSFAERYRFLGQRSGRRVVKTLSLELALKRAILVEELPRIEHVSSSLSKTEER